MMDIEASFEYEQITGFTVYAADGNKVGSVDHVFLNRGPVPENDRYYFRLAPGFLRSLTGAQPVYIPGRMVEDVDVSQRRITLMIREERLQDAHWSQPPADLGLSLELA